jgi:hypothetical protein
VDKNNLQYVQAEISRSKFVSEVEEFYKIQDIWRSKGVICLKAEFPTAQFVFVAPSIKPPAVAFAVSIDFTNYDVEPPSIVFINPFSGVPIKRKELGGLQFIQHKMTTINVNGQSLQAQQPQDLLVGQPEEYPFLCLPGVREYHNHPQHSGDPWLLHRNAGGEGTLGFLLTKLHEHCIPFIRSYHIQFNVNLQQQF